MAWEIVDADDPLGPTRYVAEGALGGLCDVRVYREGCKPWVLGTYGDLDEATKATQAWIAARRAERAEREQREGGDGE